MQFFTLAIAAATVGASMVGALPSTGNSEKLGGIVESKRDDPYEEGECNGTRCNFLYQNLDCTHGTSNEKSSGG
ncbi:hypothetical protein PG990_011019 [Apiospora arundinis]